MSSDLLFYILPRLGKTPIEPEDKTVQKVSKEAVLRQLNDEEKELNAEEKETREKQQKRNKNKAKQDNTESSAEHHEHEGVYVGEDGKTHFDDYA